MLLQLKSGNNLDRDIKSVYRSCQNVRYLHMPKKILILDDDRDIAALMDVLLRQQGFQTITAFSGEIFKELPDINPDLILMDNRLGKDYCR